MNRFAPWKTVLILLVLIFSVIYALPNLYPDEPSLQISGVNAGITVDDAQLQRVNQYLAAANIAVKSAKLEAGNILLRFSNSELQLKAKDVLQMQLGDDYLAALNLAPTTPEWLKKLGAAPIKLGLDLRGGVHFLLEVDLKSALQQRQGVLLEEVKTQLREQKIRYGQVRAASESSIQIQLRDEKDLIAAQDVLNKQLPEYQWTADNAVHMLTLQWSPQQLKKIQDYAIGQNLTTLRNRVNELGVAEALVQRQGANRIVAELPGVQDTAMAKRVLGRTANLEFRLYKSEAALAPAGSEIFSMPKEGRQVALDSQIIVSGDQVIDAQSSYDENNQPQVNITLDSKGGARINRVTREHIGDRMAVLFVEHKTRTVKKGADEQAPTVREKFLDKQVINVATIQSALGSQFRITGLDSPAESSELALMLRAGALAAPMYFVEERTVGPSLGQQNIEDGLKSIVIGFIFVVIFMQIFYKVFGLFANVAVFMNLIVTVALMSLIPGAVLTLPGMAGMVLTVGMAVDANVLIFERIREELREGHSPVRAIQMGYDRAFLTIWDSHLTTLIVAFILFAIGNGPVKGFAVTLGIGIVLSLFTAIMVTRALTYLVYERRAKLEKISI
jgi:preprotein translocase subunit SecD